MPTIKYVPRKMKGSHSSSGNKVCQYVTALNPETGK